MECNLRIRDKYSHKKEERFKNQPSKFPTQQTRKKEKIKTNIGRKKKKVLGGEGYDRG